MTGKTKTPVESAREFLSNYDNDINRDLVPNNYIVTLVNRLRGVIEYAESLERWIANEYCPHAAGFEGPETYPDCGKCLRCQIKARHESELNAGE